MAHLSEVDTPMLDIWNRPHRLWKWVANNGPSNRSPGFFTCKSSRAPYTIVSNGGVAVEIPYDKLAVCEHVSKSSMVLVDSTDGGNHLYEFVDANDHVAISRTNVLIEYGGELNRVYRNYTDITDLLVFRDNNLKFLGDPNELLLVSDGDASKLGIAVIDVDGYHAWIASVDTRLPAILPFVVKHANTLVAPAVPATPTPDNIIGMLHP